LPHPKNWKNFAFGSTTEQYINLANTVDVPVLAPEKSGDSINAPDED
jgi:hypothetical protein